MAKTEPFDLYSDEYDLWFDEHAQFYAAELEAVRQLLPTSTAGGLEVGVGSGKFAAPLGVKTGVEPSSRMAERASHLGIDVRVGVAEALPFADASFGYVLMVTTICFVDSLDEAFREACRVLRPSGSIVVGFVAKESSIGQAYIARKETSRFYREATFFSTDEVLAHLHAAGFTRPVVKQTICPGEPADVVRDGYGMCSFVVIRSHKP